MSFQPVVPGSGLQAWRFLNRTLEVQKAHHAGSAQNQRETSYFRQRIGSVTDAASLVADRTLLKVTLGAFGLQDDLGNTFFVRKILEEGTADPQALANRLSDPRYKQMAAAMGFGPLDLPGPLKADFANQIVSAYQDRSFEIAVGTQNDDLRLALNLRRELPLIAMKASSEETKWFSVMGQAPIRQVFETTFRLPQAFGTLDLDKQLEVFRDKAQAAFGTADVTQFATPAKVDALINAFLLQSQLKNGAAIQTGGAAIALSLLSARRV